LIAAQISPTTNQISGPESSRQKNISVSGWVSIAASAAIITNR